MLILAPLTQRLLFIVRLLSRGSLALLVAMTVLGLAERFLLVCAGLGFAQGAASTGSLAAAAVGIWLAKSSCRHVIALELRQRLTLAIVEAPLISPIAAVPIEHAEAAIFEGRIAAEQVLLKHLPGLAADAFGLAALLVLLHPSDQRLYLAFAAGLLTTLILVLTRRMTLQALQSAWRKYIAVATTALTSFEAAVEIVGSGHEQAFIDRAQREIRDWTATANRAELRASLIERLPLLTMVVAGLTLLARGGSLTAAQTLRLIIVVPLLASIVRTLFDLVRSAAKIETLAPVLRPSSSHVHGSRPVPERLSIRFSGVTFAFDGTAPPVLTGVCFGWEPGTILGLRGRNGAGKSTVLKLLMGLLTPTSGQIDVDGVDLSELDSVEWRRSIAYLPQRPYMPKKLAVRELMRLTVPGLTDARAQAALERLEIWRRLASDSSRDPLSVQLGSLSIGEQQRVVLARALTQQARIVLFDEPDENLDQQGLILLKGTITELARDHMVALVAHDDAVLDVATTIVDVGAFSR